MELDEAAKDWPGVSENAERFLAVNPLVPQPYRYLARASEELGKPDPAIRSYQRLLLLDPPDPADVHYHLARLLHQKGDAAGAKRQVLQALEEAPRFPTPCTASGNRRHAHRRRNQTGSEIVKTVQKILLAGAVLALVVGICVAQNWGGGGGFGGGGGGCRGGRGAGFQGSGSPDEPLISTEGGDDSERGHRAHRPRNRHPQHGHTRTGPTRRASSRTCSPSPASFTNGPPSNPRAAAPAAWCAGSTIIRTAI